MTPRRDGNAGDDLRACAKQSHDLLRQAPFTAATERAFDACCFRHWVKKLEL